MERTKKAAAAIYGGDCHLLTFIYPGFEHVAHTGACLLQESWKHTDRSNGSGGACSCHRHNREASETSEARPWAQLLLPIKVGRIEPAVPGLRSKVRQKAPASGEGPAFYTQGKEAARTNGTCLTFLLDETETRKQRACL